MRNLLLVFTAVFVTPELAAAENTKVFYVGGFRASSAQMRCWEQGAKKNAGGAYEFEGIPYPSGAGAGYQDAVGGAASDIKRVVAEINANPNKKYVIAGHSSGAAISNTIAERASNPDRLKLVDLDGFTPSAGLRSRIKDTKCWASKNQNGMQSRNYGAMGTCGAGMKVFQDNHCKTQWCLHFVLVVKSTPGDLGTDFVSRGYSGCDSNMEWLK